MVEYCAKADVLGGGAAFPFRSSATVSPSGSSSATAISGKPSPFLPLKLATTIAAGFAPTDQNVGVVVAKVPSPFPLSISTVSGPKGSVTARSRFPSPLKSAAAMALANEDAGSAIGVGAVVGKIPPPWFNKIAIALDDTAAISGLPSPLKSPTVNPAGKLSPVG